MPIEITEKMARQIYQDSLDQIAKAYFDNDFDVFKEKIHVPHKYATQDGTQHVITNYTQMRAAFHCFRNYLLGVGVTHFVRNCTGAMALSETRIIGGHLSEFLQDGTRIRAPYDVMAILELIDGTWKVISSENGLPDNAWQTMSFRQGAEKLNLPPSDGRPE